MQHVGLITRYRSNCSLDDVILNGTGSGSGLKMVSISDAGHEILSAGVARSADEIEAEMGAISASA